MRKHFGFFPVPGRQVSVWAEAEDRASAAVLAGDKPAAASDWGMAVGRWVGDPGDGCVGMYRQAVGHIGYT